MPSYEYRCEVCGDSFETERSIHAEADNPICCSAPMIRVFGSIPVRFNASGFYSTDNPKR
jgi:putative FmdB family regulatory protein